MNNIPGPTLAIGLPVFNGASYISETIDSILDQTFTDFELIISDNASIDGTKNICKQYADKDPRIKYFCNSENLGINANCKQVLMASRGAKYFMLIGHDDILEKRFAEAIIANLENDTKASIGFCFYEFVDKYSETISYNEYVDKVPDDMRGMSRLKRLMMQPSSNLIHGVVRCDSLPSDIFDKRYGIYEDVLILRYMAGLGHFNVVPEVLFRKRSHGKNYSSSDVHQKTHQSKDLLEATNRIDSLLDLSVVEMIGLWLNLNYYFRFKRPFLGHISRIYRALK